MKTNSPTHEEITQRAQKIWQESGNPSGRDNEIWFEAERQLTAGATDANAESGRKQALRTTTQSKGTTDRAEQIKVETAAESMVENHISPAISEDEAIKAALQKKEARAPKVATHTGPKSKPVESGKPLWNKAHSS